MIDGWFAGRDICIDIQKLKYTYIYIYIQIYTYMYVYLNMYIYVSSRKLATNHSALFRRMSFENESQGCDILWVSTTLRGRKLAATYRMH